MLVKRVLIFVSSGTVLQQPTFISPTMMLLCRDILPVVPNMTTSVVSADMSATCRRNSQLSGRGLPSWEGPVLLTYGSHRWCRWQSSWTHHCRRNKCRLCNTVPLLTNYTPAQPLPNDGINSGPMQPTSVQSRQTPAAIYSPRPPLSTDVADVASALSQGRQSGVEVMMWCGFFCLVHTLCFYRRRML